MSKMLSVLAKGTWLVGTAYTIGDIVDYLSSSYVCIANNTGNTPPNATYWALLSSGIEWKDAWSAGTYTKNQAVSHNGSAWIANTTTTQEPSGVATQWDLLTSKGDTGSAGTNGTNGTNGTDGSDSYVYIAYASDGSGTGFTMTFNASLDYIAVKTTTTEIVSPQASDFTGLWKNYKGATGVTGSTGATGPAGLVWHGAYDNSHAYAVNDAVYYATTGSSYMCKLASTGNLPTNTTYWDLVAQKGADGAGAGDVIGPATNTDSYIPQWNGTNSKILKDGLAVPAGGLAGITALGNKQDYSTALDNVSGVNSGDEVAAQTIGFTITKGTTPKTLTVPLDASVSGTNTGDQTLPVKASGAEADTGTDDAKFLTAKAVNDSHNIPSVAPGTTGNVMKSNGTDWISDVPAAAVSVTTKGDLQTFSTVPARLPVGTNGYPLIARSDETTGLIYTPSYILNAPQGFLINGRIVPSVANNDLTVAIKGMDGNDPSATNPVYCRIGDTIRTITAALSVTKNDGTNWFNAGSTELAAREIDYFVYLGYNATDGIVIGFARVPYGKIYSDFSATSTVENYCAISTITNAAAGDGYELIGRFAATLSAGAGYTWTVPTFTPSNLIQRPIYETRLLTFLSTWTGFDPAKTLAMYYRIINKICYLSGDATATSNTNAFTATAPLKSSVYNLLVMFGYNNSAGVMIVGELTAGSSTMVFYYNGSATGFTTSGTKGAWIQGVFYDIAT